MENSTLHIVDVRGSHEDYIKRQVTYQTKLGIDDPLLVVDIDEVVERYRKWNKLLPRVDLFYAVKCNNDMEIVDALIKLGAGFDCASKAEIEQVLEIGVDPSRIIYANPCKQNSHLTYAKEHNVDLMTFDTEQELNKIKMLYGSARLLMRIRPKKDYKVMYDLGEKFGCVTEEAVDLFISARKRGLNIVGVCFHVGSNCLSSKAFHLAIKQAREVFDLGQRLGFDMNILDIGGGYRGRDDERPTLEENADVINRCLDEYFPDGDGVRIIAEPGRYLVESAVSAAANVIGRKVIYDNDTTNAEHVMYTLNDGAYGTFTWVKEVTEEFIMSPVLNKERTVKHASTVWGPTCCSLDCLAKNMQLPLMEVGEWVHIDYAGSYSFSCITNFNNMPKPNLYYFCSHDTWASLVNVSLEVSPAADN